MTSQKTRIKNFVFYLHQVKGIYKIISGPDFSSVANYFSEMNFEFCHIRNLWLPLRTLTCHLPENIDPPHVL